MSHDTHRKTEDLEARAMSAYSAKRWDDAEQLYRAILAQRDQQGRQMARNMLGKLCERQQRMEEAIAFYEANAREHSVFWHYYHRLAIIYRRMGRRSDEERVLRAALRDVIEKARPWYENRLQQLLK